jgi:hypothetical protein
MYLRNRRWSILFIVTIIVIIVTIVCGRASESRVQLYNNTSNVPLSLEIEREKLVLYRCCTRFVRIGTVFILCTLYICPPQNARRAPLPYPARRRLTASAGNLVLVLNSFCLHFFLPIPIPWASAWPTFV